MATREVVNHYLYRDDVIGARVYLFDIQMIDNEPFEYSLYDAKEKKQYHYLKRVVGRETDHSLYCKTYVKLDMDANQRVENSLLNIGPLLDIEPNSIIVFKGFPKMKFLKSLMPKNLIYKTFPARYTNNNYCSQHTGDARCSRHIVDMMILYYWDNLCDLYGDGRVSLIDNDSNSFEYDVENLEQFISLEKMIKDSEETMDY